MVVINAQCWAYPTGWQTTGNVFEGGERGEMSQPNSMVSGDGTQHSLHAQFLTTDEHYKDMDSVLRAGFMEMGTPANVAQRPLK